MQGFVSRLDEINALADCAEGFVWRLKDDGGSATSIRVFDDPLLLVNMSVWKSLEWLKQYVYKSLHVELIRDREGWFNKMAEAHPTKGPGSIKRNPRKPGTDRGFLA